VSRRGASFFHVQIAGSARGLKQLSDLVLEKIRVDTREALHLADAALLIARKLRRKEDLALGLRTKANALHASGDNRGAVEHHEQACQNLRSPERSKGSGAHAEQFDQPLILLGEYDSAFAAAERAREIFTQLAKRGASQAWTTMWAISFTARIDSRKAIGTTSALTRRFPISGLGTSRPLLFTTWRCASSA